MPPARTVDSIPNSLPPTARARAPTSWLVAADDDGMALCRRRPTVPWCAIAFVAAAPSNPLQNDPRMWRASESEQCVPPSLGLSLGERRERLRLHVRILPPGFPPPQSVIAWRYGVRRFRPAGSIPIPLSTHPATSACAAHSSYCPEHGRSRIPENNRNVNQTVPALGGGGTPLPA
jgi:hypothetical protein